MAPDRPGPRCRAGGDLLVHVAAGDQAQETSCPRGVSRSSSPSRSAAVPGEGIGYEAGQLRREDRASPLVHARLIASIRSGPEIDLVT